LNPGLLKNSSQFDLLIFLLGVIIATCLQKDGGTGINHSRSSLGVLELNARLLWIEGSRALSPTFIPELRNKGYLIESVSTGREALEKLTDSEPELVVVNAASMRTSGVRMCRSIQERSDGLPILLISSSESPENKDICADVVLRLPFTIRKLVNRIKRLLPGDDRNLKHVGPIWLDSERNRVHCQSRDTNLTPKLTQLLILLMESPGEVLEREELFRQVWETEYTGDTRTLDVHISWLRKAIEEDPREPKILVTIRGLGYRLDV
jgi:DNA-binding response OmpR family regulator